MAIIDQIAQWAFELKYEDIPARIIEKARLQILNTLSAVLSGKYFGRLDNIASLWLPDGTATVIPSGQKTDAGHAAFVNAMYSMSFDFDDYLFMGHTGHSSVLATLAMAEENGLTLKDVITAQVIANEVEGRLGASVLLGQHNGQMWSYIHSAGSAIAISRLLGLSREHMAHAIALSLYQPNYPLAPGFMTSDSKLLTASIPIFNGIICARLAQIGFTGNTGILEAENGFLSRFAYLPLPHILSGFGKWWVTDTIAFKPYPGCAYIDTAVDSVYKIMNDYKDKTGRVLDHSHIRQIEVFANILTIGMNELSKMYDNNTLHPVNINFSIPKSIAITLINHSLYPEHLSLEMLSRCKNEIESLSQRIKLHHDWLYTLKMQAAFYESIGGRFLLNNISVFALLKAFHNIKKALPSIPLGLTGLLKAWISLSDKEKKAIRDGLKRKKDYVKMDSFTFSFGTKVKIEMDDGSMYEAEAIVPKGASSKDQTDVVMNKLNYSIGEQQRAKALYELLIPTTPAKKFMESIVMYTRDNPS